MGGKQEQRFDEFPRVIENIHLGAQASALAFYHAFSKKPERLHDPRHRIRLMWYDNEESTPSLLTDAASDIWQDETLQAFYRGMDSGRAAGLMKTFLAESLRITRYHNLHDTHPPVMIHKGVTIRDGGFAPPQIIETQQVLIDVPVWQDDVRLRHGPSFDALAMDTKDLLTMKTLPMQQSKDRILNAFGPQIHPAQFVAIRTDGIIQPTGVAVPMFSPTWEIFGLTPYQRIVLYRTQSLFMACASLHELEEKFIVPRLSRDEKMKQFTVFDYANHYSLITPSQARRYDVRRLN